jgi:hypothetical protein
VLEGGEDDRPGVDQRAVEVEEDVRIAHRLIVSTSLRHDPVVAEGEGTKAFPWVLKTPPWTSESQMHKDEDAEPPALACVVRETTLSYRLRALASNAARRRGLLVRQTP